MGGCGVLTARDWRLRPVAGVVPVASLSSATGASVPAAAERRGARRRVLGAASPSAAQPAETGRSGSRQPGDGYM
jgi:hypothetical protein